MNDKKCNRHSDAYFFEGKCLKCRNGVIPDWEDEITDIEQDEYGWISIEDAIPSDLNMEDGTELLIYTSKYYEGIIGYFAPHRKLSKWTDKEGTGIKGVTHWQLFNSPKNLA